MSLDGGYSPGFPRHGSSPHLLAATPRLRKYLFHCREPRNVASGPRRCKPAAAISDDGEPKKEMRCAGGYLLSRDSPVRGKAACRSLTGIVQYAGLSAEHIFPAGSEAASRLSRAARRLMQIPPVGGIGTPPATWRASYWCPVAGLLRRPVKSGLSAATPPIVQPGVQRSAVPRGPRNLVRVVRFTGFPRLARGNTVAPLAGFPVEPQAYRLPGSWQFRDELGAATPQRGNADGAGGAGAATRPPGLPGGSLNEISPGLRRRPPAPISSLFGCQRCSRPQRRGRRPIYAAGFSAANRGRRVRTKSSTLAGSTPLP